MLRISHCVSMLIAYFALSAAASAALEITTTTFGWDPLTQQPTAIGQTAISHYPALAVNQEFQIVFNGNLDKNSIDPDSVRIESVPASELAPLGLTSSLSGGVIAPVVYKVKKNKLTLAPAVLITNGQISFGFAPGAYYRITLKKGKVKGAGGSLPKSIEIRFRTTDQVVDQQVGAPTNAVTLVDASAGSKSLAETKLPQLNVSFSNAEVNPAPKVRVVFNELVKPNTVVDAATNGSPSVHIEIDLDGLGSTTTDRTTVPGTFSLSSSQSASTLNWTPLLDAVPGNSVYVVTIDPLIEDLVGNSVYSLTGDIGAKKVYAFKTKPSGTVVLDPIVEPFTTQAKFDSAASSADWGSSQPGFLITGPGGGTGEDGKFVAASSNVVLPTSQVVGNQVVPRIYNFSEFVIPAGVTVKAQGPFALRIFCTGPVTINGTLDVSGETPTSISPTQTTPGLGGIAAAGGGAGGLGGSVTLGSPNFQPTMVSSGVPGYATGASASRGLSGQVSAISDYSGSAGLVGSLVALMADANNAAKASGLWFQPNVGTGANATLFPNASPGGLIQHIHPLFHVKSFSGPTGNVFVFGVQDDANAVDYFGSMIQPGLDLYELPPPPIAKVGDPVVFGDLSGHEGEETGFAGSRGLGSVGLTVAQNFITQVRSGGGGGGGSRAAGEDGEDSPTFGTAEGTLGGAGGSGVITATVASVTATTITAQGTPFTGLSLGPGVDPDVSPAAIVFPLVTSGYFFEIVSNTASTLTIKPIALLQTTAADVNHDKILNLSDVAGIVNGSTLRVEPSLRIGGAGGGGSGVHLAGTVKSSLPDPSSPGNTLISLPNWTPGVGGGAGGGSVSIEAADRIGVAAGGRILARGGDGGRTTGQLATSASGGGGGGGGVIVLKSTDTTPFAVTVSGGLVDATGGTGGFGFVEGGTGGAGRVRLENRSGSLNASQYVNNSVVPALTATDLGYLVPGLSPTVALSKFFLSGALNVSYTGFTVSYEADVDGVHQTGLSFTLTDLQNNLQAPFKIEFNDAGLAPNGSVDAATVDLNFVSDPTSLSGGYIRFRVELEGSTVLGGHTYENIEIDQVSIAVSAQ